VEEYLNVDGVRMRWISFALGGDLAASGCERAEENANSEAVDAFLFVRVDVMHMT